MTISYKRAMKKRLVIALVVFTAVAAGIFYFLTTGNIGAKYNTAEVKEGEVGKYVEEVGTISSANIRRYYGNSTSRVVTLNSRLGDHVTKDQLLIKFDENLDLEIQKVRKQIEALEATYSAATSGADIESINSAKIEISRISGNIELATRNKNRIEELYNNGAAAQVELEQAVNNLAQLQSSLAVAQNNYSQLVKGVSGSTRKRYEAEIDVLLLTMQTMEKNKENSMIYADIDGVITELNTFEGDVPTAGSMILEIQDPSTKVALVQFMAEDALVIKPGMKAEIDDQNLGINLDNLKVDRIYPKAFITISELGVEENRQSVEIGIPESSDNLSFGIEVKTRVIIEESKGALLIPVDAVYERDMKKYVEVLENGEPIEREVQTGMENGNQIEIIEGLSLGESVILDYREN